MCVRERERERVVHSQVFRTCGFWYKGNPIPEDVHHGATF